ncbi:MAG: hypothetical protein PWP23_968 [Candidatus Sumerlaeota bacterium]|nr:hypothetical protein [Candidatus Sumerlaeota bacterium]
MSGLAFEVAGCHVEVAADDDLLLRLRLLYEKFPPPASDAPARVRLRWDKNTCCGTIAGTELPPTRVDDPARRAAVTGSLLARILTHLNPDFVILHGNALRSRQGKGVVLLVGDSGAGKTTLTRELADGDSSEWEPVAEDVLIIDPENQVLFPYPRALSIRRENVFPHDDEKEFHPHPGGASGPIHLGKARVFLLSAEVPSPTPPSNFDEEFEVVWVTHGTPVLRRALKDAGLPLVAFQRTDGIVRLEYMRLLDAREKRTQAGILDEHGAMILATGVTARDHTARPPVRPSRPRLRSLPAGEGVRHCLPHVVRPSTDSALTPGGRYFLRLARSFQTAAFFLLVPGGSPRDSAWAVAEALIP